MGDAQAVQWPSNTMNAAAVGRHFAGRAPEVRAIYDALVAASRVWGDVEEDPKRTSIHLNRRSAFAGVATRKDAVVLTLKSKTDIKSNRIAKRERASAGRWYVEVRLTSVADVDAELKRWLKESYQISA